MAETGRVQHDPVIGYYHRVVDGPPILADGHLHAPTAPGLGITLRDDFPTLSH
jgi:L-alanine-DL-glutamate epimerase-like enolase superfamily enzyme